MAERSGAINPRVDPVTGEYMDIAVINLGVSGMWRPPQKILVSTALTKIIHQLSPTPVPLANRERLASAPDYVIYCLYYCVYT